jgi:precorrin-2 dehydrogenase/sirohydrochlorin ferrochelatase
VTAPSPPSYPVSLQVAGRACLVVGGGPVAARKARGLLAAGALVTVVAPDLGPDMEALAPLTVQRRLFTLPSVHRDGPVTIAVSTAGSSPALASWLRRQLAAQSGPGLGALADLLGRARALVLASGRSTETVDWAGLLDGPLPGLVRDGRTDEAARLVEAAAGVEFR